MRKTIRSIMIIIAVMMSINVPSFAAEYPDSFWGPNAQYEQALINNDHAGIIGYGKQLINIMSAQPETDAKRNVMVTRYEKVGLSYAALGDYNNAAETFQSMYDYVSQFTSGPGDLYYDNLVIAPAKIKQYKTEIKMYTDGGSSLNYGAKNEKENGVLFGICSNGHTRKYLENESMVLVYQELGQHLLDYNEAEVKAAAQKGLAVVLALNCVRERADILNIRNMESYLGEISDMLKKYPNVPIYLRFGAEFDIWSNMAEPEEYKSAFRYVSKYFKDRNSNVAIVWSPNKVSGWNVDIDDFYPGDEYVDWVGISLYAQRYFLGGSNREENNEIAFMSGKNSNPVIMVKDIVEKYGSRKPIMLSESGVCHTMMNTGEDTTAFAIQRLKEMYHYLPMVYPQIKLMAYFDWYVDMSGESDDYRLSSNSSVQNEYLELVKGSRFIQGSYNNSTAYCYRPIDNETSLNSIFEVSCYAHMYDATLTGVTYYIDGKYAGMSQKIPFTTYIDAAEYSGRHTLKAVAAFDNGKTLTTESVVRIGSKSEPITVEVSGKKVDFDQDPVMYNDRTMVPMRKIFEELGATVSWDGVTQTATGVKGNRTVKVSVGKNTIYINGKAVVFDTAPIILSDRTLVPARAVAEGLGCTVVWDGENRRVLITQ